MPINTRLQFRKGTGVEWVSVDPVLASGEPGYDVTNNILKIGNGVDPWSALQGITGGGGGGDIGYSRGFFVLNEPSGTFVVDGGYTANFLDVYLNGVKLFPSGDYTATNGVTFTLSQNAPSGSVVEYMAPAVTAQGVQGIQGNDGPQGIQGVQGPQGTVGIQGDFGIQGIQGVQGLQGIQGIQGTQGIATDFGARGYFFLNEASGTFTTENGYTIGYLDVFLNGVKLSPSGDYTATDGSTFSLTTSAPSGSTIEYVAPILGSQGIQGIQGTQGISLDYGVRGSFILNEPSGTFSVENGYTVGYLDVYVNGVKLSSTLDYTATNGSTFSLNEMAPSGSIIEYVAPVLGSQGPQGIQGIQGLQGIAGIGTQGVQGVQGPVGAGLDSVSGSGVSDRVAYWVSSSGISYDDNLYWDSSNNRLGIGNTNPVSALDVSGVITSNNGNSDQWSANSARMWFLS